jgi:hypothetical protein
LSTRRSRSRMESREVTRSGWWGRARADILNLLLEGLKRSSLSGCWAQPGNDEPTANMGPGSVKPAGQCLDPPAAA